MPTVTMERLDEIATAWRSGLDADELANPAGPLFTGDVYTEYDITAMSLPYTKWTVVTVLREHCVCCREVS